MAGIQCVMGSNIVMPPLSFHQDIERNCKTSRLTVKQHSWNTTLATLSIFIMTL